MSENIVKKIKEKEAKAEGFIVKAKKEAYSHVNQAQAKMEEDIKAYKTELTEALKGFRQEKEAACRLESEKFEKDMDRERQEYISKIEDKLPEIKEEVKKLIKRELCL